MSLLITACALMPFTLSLGAIESAKTPSNPGFPSSPVQGVFANNDGGFGNQPRPVTMIQRPIGDASALAIQNTEGMVADAEILSLVRDAGLSLVNLTWEDTGRYKGSSVGPNISDMTIQVRDAEGGYHPTPVIRHDNFVDKTGDIDPRELTLLVGNHRGAALKRISLYDFLADPTPYLSQPFRWHRNDGVRTLLAPRDEKVLISAQACFLPVPASGKATFTPVLFNYQSYDEPAVLTLLVTREGTSVTTITNRGSEAEGRRFWGQPLYFNANGQRAAFTGTRLSDLRRTSEGASVAISNDTKSLGSEGLSTVMLIQIPLKHKERRGGYSDISLSMAAESVEKRSGSANESAVIGHAEPEGPFTEIDDRAIERDDRFPIRVTVQMYRATSTGKISPEEMQLVTRSIENVYAKSRNVGSLVVGGETGRITEYEGAKVQPAGWWEDFWSHYRRNGGEIIWAERFLYTHFGKNPRNQPVTELMLRDVLRAAKRE